MKTGKVFLTPLVNGERVVCMFLPFKYVSTNGPLGPRSSEYCKGKDGGMGKD